MAIFSQLGNYKNFGLLVMRAGVGALLFRHGLPKLEMGPAKWESLGSSMSNLHIHFFPVFWGFMSAITECIGGLFCVLGLWFRLVSLLMFFNFIVAFMALYTGGKDILGSSEAIVLVFVFFGFLFLGPGTYSVDKG